MKKLLIIVVCFVMILTCVCGCSQNKSSGNSDAKLSELEAKYIGSDTPVELVKDGTANYKVTRPEDASAEINSLGTLITKTLKDNLN